ncbi:MAG TPA: RES family NAD+ phosphorylase [Candidatus Tumulicola sp.]
MRVYRAFQRKHESGAFSGEGARRYGGRWNSPGVPVVYTAENFSLALLEIMVNVSSSHIPADMVYAPIDIPDNVVLETLDTNALPQRWFEYPAPAECQRLGDRWATGASSVGLRVPSAIARIEKNVLLNPAHRDFARLTIGASDVLSIDVRLRGVS